LERFFKAVGSLPFVGKFSIGKEVFEVYEATSMAGREKEYSEALTLLIVMIIGHALQTWLGYGALGLQAPLFAKAYFLLYTLANASVTMTQVWLLWRVTDFHLTHPTAKRQRKSFRPRPKQVTYAYTFTLVAQMIFLVLYTHFH
jgi:hypothetical protein